MCKPESGIFCVYPVNEAEHLWRAEEIPPLGSKSRFSRPDSGRAGAKQASGADFHS